MPSAKLYSVLNPSNATIIGPSATAGAPAYSGALSASDVPFTSGLPTPSRSIRATPTSSSLLSLSTPLEVSTAGAVPAVQTGAVGIGALLGVAAVYFI